MHLSVHAFPPFFAGLAVCLAISACKPAPEPAPVPESAVTAPATRTPAGLVVPAVWQSADLDSPVADLAIAGTLVAIAHTDGGLQLLDFWGERVTPRADFAVRRLANGRDLTLQGQPVTLFPGIDMKGDIALYLHGGGPAAPVPWSLNTGIAGPVAGLCSAPPADDSDGVLRLGFWTQADQRILHSGRVVEIADALIFLADEPVPAAIDISACILSEAGAVIHARPTIAMARLQDGGDGGDHTLLLDSDGALVLLTAGDSETTPLAIRDGLTVTAPDVPVAMAAIDDARAGGYPGGMIVIAGPGRGGVHAVTYIDSARLTRP